MVISLRSLFGQELVTYSEYFLPLSCLLQRVEKQRQSQLGILPPNLRTQAKRVALQCLDSFLSVLCA